MYDFVSHWKEQDLEHEALEIEPLPPKHKLQMLQNVVCNVPKLLCVNKIEDQDIAQGNPLLDLEGYMKVLLLECVPLTTI
jgi:hypothetical protein